MLSKTKDSKAIYEQIMLIPVIFAIAVIPLIAKFTIFDPMLSDYSWYSNEGQEGDIFMNCKQTAMFVLDGLLVLGITQLALRKELPRLKAFLLLALYGVLILLSTFASISPYHSWNGFYGMMESTAVLLGYCAICYYTYGVVKTEKHLKMVMFSLFISIVVLCGIGLTQMFGHDFFLSDFGKALVFPSEYASYKDSIVQNFAGRVSSTLFNPNYVGIYACMVIPVLLTLAFSVKKKVHLILYFTLLALSTAALVGAGSKTAILTLAPCLLFLMIYYGRQLGKKVIPLIAAMIAVVVVLTFYQGSNSLISHIIYRFSLGYTPEIDYYIEDITLNDDHYIVEFKDKELKVSYDTEADDYTLQITDEIGTSLPVQYIESEGLYRLEDTYYAELSFQALTANNKQIGYILGCADIGSDDKYNICYSPKDETYYYLNGFGKYTKLYEAYVIDCPLFHFMEGFSNRDYIWQRTLPMLKETIFLGTGPDTYAFMFPQYDYIGAAQSGYDTTIVTKPHNTYLQIAVQTGIISMLAYVAFYLIYLIDSIKLYAKRTLNTFAERCGAGIFIGSMCYMIAGLLHDSTIGVSIVFWVMIALGFTCNRMIREAENLPVEMITWKPNLRPMQIILICFVSGIVIIGGHYVTHTIADKPIDGRMTFKTSAIGYVDKNEQQTIPFQASMSTEWNFADSKSASANAFVANKETNQYPIYFDVVLESGETIYTSSVLKVGDRVDSIALEKELDAGTYSATVIYHLLGEYENEVAKAQINITINILK